MTHFVLSRGAVAAISPVERRRAVAGGKAGGLVTLDAAAGRLFSVPRWACISTAAFELHCARPGVRRAIEELHAAAARGGDDDRAVLVELGAAVRAAICHEPLDERIASELIACWHGWGCTPVAVRSSACDEDGDTTSFAGMYESVLNVRSERMLLEAVRVCWGSAFGERRMALQRATDTGAGRGGAPVAVVVQEMCIGESSGVATSCDPVSGRDVAVISAARGLGDGVVSGDEASDTYHVTRDDGLCTCHLAQSRAVLSPRQIRSVARAAVHVGAMLGADADIEWVVTGRDLALVQARPLAQARRTVLTHEQHLWNNHSTEEQLGGSVLPLSYAALDALQDAIGDAMERLLAGRRRGRTGAGRHVLGHINGHVFLDELAWQKFDAVVPAWGRYSARLRRGLGLPAATVKPLGAGPWFRALGRLWALRLRVRWAQFTAIGSVRRARRRVARLIGEPTAALNFTTFLREYARCVATASARIDAVCALIAAHTDNLDAMRPTCLAPHVAALQAFRAAPSQERWDTYRQLASDRLADGLKLESGQLSAQLPATSPASSARQVGERQQTTAQESGLDRTAAPTSDSRASRSPVRAFITWRGRRLFSAREQMGWTRSLAFAHLRTLALTLAEQLVQLDKLDHVDDIFFCSLADLDTATKGLNRTPADDDVGAPPPPRGFAGPLPRAFAGHLPRAFAGHLPRDLQAIVAAQRERYRGYAMLPPLPPYFSTRGAPPDPLVFNSTDTGPSEHAVSDSDSDDLFVGMGCAPGVVTGTACFVGDGQRDPVTIGDHEIAVCERLSPDLIALLSGAGGVIVERGSALSHAIIIARELGIPVVMGLHAAHALLRPGMRLTLDGGAGTVRRSSHQ